MSMYKEWTDFVVNFVKTKGEDAFWTEYGEVEKKMYTKVLSNHKEVEKGSFKELTEKFDVNNILFEGFLDGINDSLKTSLKIEEIQEDTYIELDIDYEKLYSNMLDAQADYLYELPQWEAIFSKEKRIEITKAYKKSKIIVNPNKVGRNDPCPCGSGKKYKKCCGAGK